MIKTQVIGYLGKDAIVNTINGKSVINFSVAHSEKYKDQKGENRDHTTWVNCSWWTDKLNVLPYLKQGTLVYAEGKPAVDVYKNAKGEAVPQLRLRIDGVHLLGSKKENNNSHPQDGNAPSEVVDDLPF